MKNEFTVSETLNASAETIYNAWLSTQGHTLMTGSPAKVDGRVKGEFTAWDGYIWGTFLELEASKRIVQAWRTSEFPDDADDSKVEVLLEEKDGKTKVTLIHSNIPEDQEDSYKQGWEDFYFKPMREYFGE
ncbi:MAG: SRPBCC domain-containing protein [Anaerolineae bacterium]|nr:SRPBCC domain-containing protein [Anaerolineae bacterium]